MSVDDASIGADAHWTLRTLGEAALYRAERGSERALVFDVGKPLATIVYLALSPGRSESRERLVDLLWSNLEPSAAGAAVRQVIWQIRRRLSDGAISTVKDRLTLLASIDCDRDDYLAAWQRRDLESVVRLYRGDFLPAFAVPGGAEFERWAEGERRLLRGVFVRASEIVVREWVSSARHREARDLARRVRDLDPFNQAAWRLLFESLVASRDALGAAVEIDAFERLCSAEEFEPEPATQALVRLARGNGGSVYSVPGSGPTRESIHELVGREREFSNILEAWEHSREGRFRHVHVTGPAGLGKTRLLTDVHARLRASLARAVFVRAEYGARDIAYAFASDVAAALATRPGARGISTQAAGSLVALNPSLSTFFDAAPDASVEDEALRRRAFALRELIATLTEDQPVALLLDDLHWSDPLSLRVLEAAFAGLDRARVFVVTAARNTPDDLRGVTRATSIALTPLTTEAVATLVSGLAALPSLPWAERLPIALCDAANGSPLLVIETLQLLTERQLLTPLPTGWVTGDEAALFQALGGGSALLRRMENLEIGQRFLLLLMAVVGVPLSLRRLCAASAGRSSDASAALDALHERGLVARRGVEWSSAHDEHASAVLDAASEDDVRNAAAMAGAAIAADAGIDIRDLRLAGPLLVRGGDVAGASRLFERYVRRARLDGDRRSNRQLARELLGPAATAGAAASLARSLPFLVRTGLVSARRIAAAAAAAIVLSMTIAVAVTKLSAKQPSVADVVLAMFRPVSGDSVFAVFEVPVDVSRWDAGGVIEVRPGRREKWRQAAGGVGGRKLRPDGKGWTVGRVVPDSGIEDVFDLDREGGKRRLTYERGDDLQPAWAPDNERFVFVTGRWNERARYDLAIYDVSSRVARPLTLGDDWDTEPTWSPDGSRIAFRRQHLSRGDVSLCVIDVDGAHLRCMQSLIGIVASVLHWSDAHHVLLLNGKGEAFRLTQLDVETGHETILDMDAAHGDMQISPDGKWVVCTCKRRGYPASTPIMYPVARPNAFRALHVVNRDSSDIFFEWAPTSAWPRYVAGLRILPGLGSPIVGSTHQLRATAIDSTGDMIEPGVLRWRSLDTTVATIDSAGVLLPRHAGLARIEASVGGWRRAQSTLTMIESVSRTLVDERWRDTLLAAWVKFGEPLPKVVRSKHFPNALLNNGDGVFESGVYSARAFDTHAGLWLDAEISAPITAPEWQEQMVGLVSIADSTTSSGGYSSRGPPIGSARCLLRFPQGGSGVFRGDSLFIGPLLGARSWPAPRTARSGRPFHVLIQIFPDGRCGIAVDGAAMAISPPGWVSPRAHVLLSGNSAGTRMVVGRVRVGTGIAPHVEWDARPADGAPSRQALYKPSR
jgi:DNA-binding SARP family transcriptional activator